MASAGQVCLLFVIIYCWISPVVLSKSCVLYYGASTCAFPSSFVNTWKTSSRGTWTVTSSKISSFKTIMETGNTETLYTMGCHLTYNGYYVLKSDETFDSNQYVYTCLNLNSVSSSKYTFSLLTTSNEVKTNVYERVVLKSTSDVVNDGADICNDTNTAGERTHVALLNGTETSGKTTCPSSIQGTFTYLGTTCSTTYVDICSDTSKITFDKTKCSENMMYSENGILDCVYYTTVGTKTYLTLYNEDSSPDGTNYYQFTCLVYSKTGVYVYVTVNPDECLSSQTSTIAPSSGTATVLEDDTNSSCYVTESTDDSTKTALLAVLGVLATLCLVELIVGICCAYTVLRKRARARRRTGAKSNLIDE